MEKTESGTMVILIVDDEPLIRKTLREEIVDQGYIALEASDGEECLAILKQQHVDIVLMDVQMPRMNGMETFRRMLREEYHIETIIMSGHGDIEMAVAAIKCGAFDFLEKPFSIGRLKQSLSLAVHRRMAAQQLSELKREGRRIGKYAVGEELARGATATIYRATQLTLNKPVALKILHPHLTRNTNFAKRFFREAQIAASLSHPSIVQVFDFGHQDDLYFIAMDLIEGNSLATYLDKKSMLPIDVCAAVGMEICRALEHAHERGVVHRDIKPQNVLVTDTGQVRLVDFGLAWTIQSQNLDLTGAGTVAGTPQFMSPEQIRDVEVGPQSDIFSLGTLLYLLATLTIPWRGDSIAAIVHSILNDEMEPPWVRNKKCNEHIGEIIMRCCERDLKKRFVHASDVREEFIRYFEDSGINAHELLESFFGRNKSNS